MHYEFIGWNTNGNSDKIWAVAMLAGTINTHLDHKWVIVWGRRGKNLQHKIVENADWEIQRRINQQLQSGYRSISYDNVDGVYPGLSEALEKVFTWALLKI